MVLVEFTPIAGVRTVPWNRVKRSLAAPFLGSDRCISDRTCRNTVRIATPYADHNADSGEPSLYAIYSPRECRGMRTFGNSVGAL